MASWNGKIKKESLSKIWGKGGEDIVQFWDCDFTSYTTLDKLFEVIFSFIRRTYNAYTWDVEHDD